ncbi:nucleotidyltransferase [Sporohalobacter salinus]|uniref:nucleotidyltransferase n=1 Tax=Sporohalobacter salinus TaxID=1494606 RepID=UPI001960BCA0|nr:nucleotidyltransferase [Sporohalobacter salinus]MBM7623806.1 putative nucleotidyltransferase [Sporohalobacter salinus]
MKVVGLIAEYNPFHYGHKYHLEKSLKLTEADYSICIMSGNFVQRGQPAICNKWSRTRMALKAGIDLILELPVTYALRSAEHFAYGAVQLLNKTKIVDQLVFGSEVGSITPLLTIGKVLADEPSKLSHLIQSNLKKGISFPKARANALIDYFSQTETKLAPKKIRKIISSPNNILGLEYIKALSRTESSIQPLTIKRRGADYHQKDIETQIVSATAIRNKILNDKLGHDLSTKIPAYTNNIITKEINNGRAPVTIQNFNLTILSILRRASKKELTKFEDVKAGLKNRIKDAATKTASLSELINLIKTKRFTQTRIQRILFHSLLNLQQKNLYEFDNTGGPQYLRILGFNQQGRKLLSVISNKGELPLINRVANHYQSSYPPQSLKEKMLAADIRATNIYSLGYNNEEFRHGGQDYRKPIILKN